MSKHEHAKNEMRKAAARVAEGHMHAMGSLAYWRNEWHNSRPRDAQNVPL